MAEDRRNQAQRNRIAAFLRELMAHHGKDRITLKQLEKKTGLSKSRLGNYTQATRLMSLEEAVVLATVFKGVTAAQILCVDEDMTPFSPAERQIILDLRALPENMRMEYVRSIAALAAAHRDPADFKTPRVAKRPAPPKLKR